VVVALATSAPGAAEHGQADQTANMYHHFNSQKAESSDLAFWRGEPVKGPFQNLAIAGNYEGFRIFDISKPWLPVLLSDFFCRGLQGDGSVYRAHNRLIYIQSIDQGLASEACTAPNFVPGGDPVARFEGLRVFDITNPVAPVHIASVRTVCGSHTHTTIPDNKNQRLIVYVSSNPGGAGSIFCPQPHGKISIVEIPFRDPAAAHLLKEQPLHEDTLPYFRDGFSAGVACHDITAFLAAKPPIAFASCQSEGQIWDISDPANPSTLGAHTHVRNPAVGHWHSSSFTWDGEVLAVSDESSGHCGGPADTVGNMWFYEVVPPGTPEAPLLGRWTPTRPHAEGSCFVHNGNVIPTTKGYLGVVPMWRGGVSVYDFTNPAAAHEIAYFDPSGADGRGSPEAWAGYWYNDYVYVNDFVRGLDVFHVRHENGRQLRAQKWHHLNAQTQERFQAVGRRGHARAD
jgi:hypothetical protein